MRSLTIPLIFLLVFVINCEQKTKTLQNANEGKNNEIIAPSEAPDQWLLAHIDVETTGLIPGYHEMIDIGIVMTDLQGKILDSLFLRIQPEHPERLSPGAYAVNGFSVERWRIHGALSPTPAVDSIVVFHERTAKNKRVLMVAYNSQFDAAFLDHLFRRANKTWRALYHYFVLDIPSMGWGLGFYDLTSRKIMEKHHIPDEPHIAEEHTGITGAMKNVRIYQALLQHSEELRNQKPITK